MSLPVCNKQDLLPEPHCIAIASGKGGVGKSTVTVNLALALKERGYKVGILDADLHGPSIETMIPVDYPPKREGAKLHPGLAMGIKTVSMAHFCEKGQACGVRAPIANGIIRQFISDVLWGGIDYLLIDFPPGTGDIQLSLAQSAKMSGALVVTTPQEIALQDVRRAIDLFQKVGVPLLGVVENMSFYRHSSGEKIHLFGEGGGRILADENKISLLQQLPIDPLIGKSADRGESLFHLQNGQEAGVARLFLALACQLEQAVQKIEQQGLLQVRLVHEKEVEILWKDGKKQTLSAKTVQENCPCAGCQEQKEKIFGNFTSVDPVGQYALRFSFQKGCSQGIYPFDYIKNLEKQEVVQ